MTSTSSKPKEGMDREKFEEWCKERKIDRFSTQYRYKADRFPNTRKFMEDRGEGYWDVKYQGYGYYRNPNAKWDWWQIGGRWTGLLIAKHPEMGFRGERSLLDDRREALPLNQCDICQIKNIDFEAIEAKNKANAEKWWAEAWRQYPGDEKAGHRDMIYGIKEGQTEQDYIRYHSKFSTFAVLLDGKWHEKGDMGWWGIVSDEKAPADWENEFNKLLKSLDPEDWVAIVDVHI